MIKYTDEYIERLLDRFMNGESSLEEEAQLGEYFRTQTVRKEWETYREMFEYFDGGMEETSRNITDAQADASEPAIKKTYARKAGRNVSMMLWRYIAIAASVAFVLVMIHTRDDKANVTAVEQYKCTVLPGMDNTEPGITPAADNNAAANNSAVKNVTAANKRHSARRILRKDASGNNEISCAMDSVKEELRRVELEIAIAENTIAEMRGKAIVADVMAREMQTVAQDDMLGGGYDSDSPLRNSRIRALVMP